MNVAAASPERSFLKDIPYVQSNKFIPKYTFEGDDEKLPKPIQNFVDTKFPTKAKELMNASSLGPGVAQIFQEFLMQYIPKGIGGVVMRGSWLMAIFELLVEVPEYFGLYIFPTALSAGLAPFISKTLQIPSFRLLGEPIWKLKENLNKEFQLKSPKIPSFKLNEGMLNKIAFGKFMLFSTVAGAVCAAQVLSTVPQTLLIGLFGTDNFYAISGLEVPESEKHGSGDSEKAKNQARKNLKNALAYLAVSIPALMGLIKLMAPFAEKAKWSVQASKFFDLAPKFGISKMLTAFGLAIAPWAYMSVSLNESAKLEARDRLLYCSIPAVLLFKQVIGNILVFFTGLFNGAGNILAPVSKAWNEVKTGRREIFDLGLFDPEYAKNSKGMRKLSEHKKEKIIKTANFMNHQAVYGMALLYGLVLNWLNYKRTSDMCAQNKLNSSGAESSKNKNQINNENSSKLNFANQRKIEN